MAALSLALPFSTFLYLLSSTPNISPGTEVMTTVTENNIVGIIDVSKEIRRDNGKLEQSYLNGGSLYPLGILKPSPRIDSVNDAMKLGTRRNMDFQAKESRKRVDDGTSTNVLSAKRSHDVSADVDKDEKRIKTRIFKNGNLKNANVFHLHVPDITDMLIEKFAKPSVQSRSGVALRNTNGKNNADTRRQLMPTIKRGISYIQICKKTGLQKNRICTKFPTSEFYVEYEEPESGSNEQDDEIDTSIELLNNSVN